MILENRGVQPIVGWKQAGNFAFGAAEVVELASASAAPSVFVQEMGTYLVPNLTLLNLTALDALWMPKRRLCVSLPSPRGWQHGEQVTPR